MADSAITVGAVPLISGDLIRGSPTMYPLLFDLGFVSVYSYGVILAAAYVLALRYAIHRARRAGLDGQRIFDVGFVGIFGAFVGAKLMLVVVDFGRYASDPSQLMGLVSSGGVFYGGLLLAVPVCWWYIRRSRLPLWTTCDMFAPGIALAQGVGRMGCLLAGCCYGQPTEAPWGITFTSTLAAANAGTPLGIALHPTQIYEAAAVLAILGVLLVGEHRWRAFPGRTFWTYLLLYGAARIALELYRGDPRGMVFDALPTSQFVSALIVPASIVMLVYLGRRGATAGAAGPRPTRARASAP